MAAPYSSPKTPHQYHRAIFSRTLWLWAFAPNSAKIAVRGISCVGYGVKANEVKLTEKEYYVRGCTALLDAVGKTILDVGHRLSRTSEDERPGKVIFVITTDGLENASREFTYEKVKGLIKHQQEKYNWEFIFLGANIDVAKEADSIGISMDNAYDFEASENGVQEMYCLASEAVTEKRKKSSKKK
jgi:hypothetical protein